MATTLETADKVKTLISLHNSTNELLDLIKRNVGLDKSAVVEKSIVDFVRKELDSLARLGLPVNEAKELIRVSRQTKVYLSVPAS